MKNHKIFLSLRKLKMYLSKSALVDTIGKRIIKIS